MRNFRSRPSGVRRAFSAIEIVIVVVVLAVMAAAFAPSYLRAQAAGRNVNAVKVLRGIAVGLEAYNLDNPGYPFANLDGVLGPDVNEPMALNTYAMLTTPIAYLVGAMPADEYPPTTTMVGVSPIDGSFATQPPIDATTSVYKAPRYFSVHSTPGDIFASTSHYVLASSGSDLIAPSIVPLFNTATVQKAAIVNNVYDPTNGTTSRGDIYRIGGENIPAVNEDVPGALFLNTIQERGGYLTPAVGNPMTFEVSDTLIFPENETIYTKYYELNADNLVDGADVQAVNP